MDGGDGGGEGEQQPKQLCLQRQRTVQECARRLKGRSGAILGTCTAFRKTSLRCCDVDGLGGGGEVGSKSKEHSLRKKFKVGCSTLGIFETSASHVSLVRNEALVLKSFA